MSYPLETHPQPSSAPHRLPYLLTVLAVLLAILILPYGAEQWTYARRRGELRAQADVATEELARLGAGAQLVPLTDTARVFRAVAVICIWPLEELTFTSISTSARKADPTSASAVARPA